MRYGSLHGSLLGLEVVSVTHIHSFFLNNVAVRVVVILFMFLLKEALSINALHSCVYIYDWQLSSLRVPTLWFIDLTVATCHIQYTFLSFCQFFS